MNLLKLKQNRIAQNKSPLYKIETTYCHENNI